MEKITLIKRLRDLGGYTHTDGQTYGNISLLDAKNFVEDIIKQAEWDARDAGIPPKSKSILMLAQYNSVIVDQKWKMLGISMGSLSLQDAQMILKSIASINRACHQLGKTLSAIANDIP